MSKRTIWTTDTFTARADAIHDGKYDYSDVVFRSTKIKVSVGCPEHGPWRVVPASHLRGSGCPACAREANKAKIAKGKGLGSRDAILTRCHEAHGDKFEYRGITDATRVTDKVTIVCPEHGPFDQTLMSHLRGHGCRACYDQTISARMRSVPRSDRVERGRSWAKRNGYGGRDNLIAKLGAVHGGKYDFSAVTDDTRATTRITVVCPDHGEWSTLPNWVLSVGHGCPDCAYAEGSSKGERSMADFVAGLGVTVVRNDRETVGMEMDVWVPEHRIGIEYNGNYFHSDRFSRQAKLTHVKTSLAREAGVRLITIFEDEWVDPVKRKVTESFLRAQLGVFDRALNARSMMVAYIDGTEAKAFLDTAHMAGHTAAKHNLALIGPDGSIAMLATFRKPRSFMGKTGVDMWELARMAAAPGIRVRGGVSRLMHHWRKTHPEPLLSYVDRRLHAGGGYEAVGFKLDGATAPGYYWTKHSTRKHRYSFSKFRLKLEFDRGACPEYADDKTEDQIMRERGWSKLYDAGNLRFVMS